VHYPPRDFEPGLPSPGMTILVWRSARTPRRSSRGEVRRDSLAVMTSSWPELVHAGSDRALSYPVTYHRRRQTIKLELVPDFDDAGERHPVPPHVSIAHNQNS